MTCARYETIKRQEEAEGAVIVNWDNELEAFEACTS
jgi:hypothetical protein